MRSSSRRTTRRATCRTPSTWRGPEQATLPDPALVDRVRRTHEDGGDTGSIGWRTRWNPALAERCVLRTHTTAATARALYADPKPPRRIFSVGPVFRRETIDYKHLPVFHQVDGIVIDANASFAMLLTLLTTFYRKMGFPRIQFRPAFFPYTEPSVEVFVCLESRQDWVEMGGAGVFRPEVTEPLGLHGAGPGLGPRPRARRDVPLRPVGHPRDLPRAPRLAQGDAAVPVLGIPLDELFARYGATIEPEELEHQLHRFGCSVEGWATAYRWRCPSCGTLSEGGEDAAPPPACEGCGADLRSAATPGAPAGQVQVLRMELLAVRPDLFGPEGLARGLRGFLRRESGAPRYRVEPGSFSVDVDPGLAGPGVHRPRIVAAIVRGLTLDDARLRGLMKLQENVHWALGRDRKLASIGVYDLATVAGPALSYRAVELDGLRFVPLGFDPSQPHSALTPREILAKHPKGTAYAWLLEGNTKAPLLTDAKGGVLSMPPIINSEATRVTTATKDVVIDVTGLADRHIDKALAMVVTSLLEACPGAHAETVTVRYAGETRVTPDLAPHEVVLDPVAAGRLIGVPWTADEVAGLLRFMRHDATVADGQVRVLVPAWRSDILHPRDLVEDAAIAHGYDRIPAIGLAAATIGLPQPREEAAVRARAALAGLGSSRS